MGYKISVNHQLLRSKAQELSEHGKAVYKNIKQAALAGSEMKTHWTGEDATAYIQKLESIDDSSSIVIDTYKAIQNSVKYLETIATEYTNAQANAIFRAKRLK